VSPEAPGCERGHQERRGEPGRDVARHGSGDEPEHDDGDTDRAESRPDGIMSIAVAVAGSGWTRSRSRSTTEAVLDRRQCCHIERSGRRGRIHPERDVGQGGHSRGRISRRGTVRRGIGSSGQTRRLR
jgi:hypothetical protein